MSMPEPREITLHNQTVRLADILAYRTRSRPRLTVLRLRDGTNMQFWDDDADAIGAWLGRMALRGRRRAYDA